MFCKLGTTELLTEAAGALSASIVPVRSVVGVFLGSGLL